MLGVSGRSRGLGGLTPPQVCFTCQFEGVGQTCFFACELENAYGPSSSGTLPPPPCKNSWIRLCGLVYISFRKYPIPSSLPP